VAAARDGPGDLSAGGLAGLEGQVAAGGGFDGVDRRSRAVGAGEEDQAVGDNRRRHRDVAAAADGPEFVAGGQVVAGGFLVAVADDLGEVALAVDGRRGPSWHVGARGAPDLL